MFITLNYVVIYRSYYMLSADSLIYNNRHGYINQEV